MSALLAGAEERTGETAPSALPDEAFQLSLTPALITDADSSQYAAIIEAARGKNLVIEGPPGTGKSQTITNVIAAALEMGKTVLFVAEKAAALEVVKSRLDAAGLGAFCLEMHSTKARKADVHAAIQRRLRLAVSPEGDPQTAFKSTEREAEILSGYSSELNSTVGASNASLHTTVWRQERLRQEIGEDMALHFESTRVDEVSAIEPHVLSTMIETVVAWRDRRKALASVWGDVDRYPLVFVAAPHMNDRELRAFTSVVEDCVEKSIAVSAALVKFERVFGALSGKSIDDLISTFMIFSKLQHLTGAPKSVVQCLEAKVDHTIIAEWVADRAAIEDSLASYGTSVVVAGESQFSTLARIRTLAETRSLADEISLSEVRRLLSADQQELQRLRELFLDNEAA